MRSASRHRLLALLILLLGTGFGCLMLIGFERHGELWLSRYLVDTGLQILALLLGMAVLALPVWLGFSLYRLGGS